MSPLIVALIGPSGSGKSTFIDILLGFITTGTGEISIDGKPLNEINHIKYRENFRPFAPAILEEEVDKHFDIGGKSPYMLIVAPVNENIRIKRKDE